MKTIFGILIAFYTPFVFGEVTSDVDSDLHYEQVSCQLPNGDIHAEGAVLQAGSGIIECTEHGFTWSTRTESMPLRSSEYLAVMRGLYSPGVRFCLGGYVFEIGRDPENQDRLKEIGVRHSPDGYSRTMKCDDVESSDSFQIVPYCKSWQGYAYYEIGDIGMGGPDGAKYFHCTPDGLKFYQHLGNRRVNLPASPFDGKAYSHGTVICVNGTLLQAVRNSWEARGRCN